MKLQFIGCGSAFTTKDFYQSNVLVTAKSGKKLLIDCGSDARFALAELKVGIEEIDAVYISHLHADHIGGLEWLAFCTYFNPKLKRPKLYMIQGLMEELWYHSLQGGLDSLEGKKANLTDYFDCCMLAGNGYFTWEEIRFTPIQTIHVMSGMSIMISFGLLIEEVKSQFPLIFFTSDTQYCPHQIMHFYESANIILQDCETGEFPSGVHAHILELKDLPVEVKRKMWLYHYQPNGPKDFKPQDWGFQGFVSKGQIFKT